jgi:large subunit ribosomal protein L15
MKLHDLRPAAGSKTERTRVGRGIAAGKGKTAGRGTKGQKSRAGGNLPPWFEGGQTPIHMRVPKLRGFKRRGRIEYEVVNLGDIERAAERGRLVAAEPGEDSGDTAAKKRGRSTADAPLTVNAETLQGAGLVRELRRPLKVLGDGEISRKLFVVAEAFTKSARQKIEAAGGTAMTLEIPGRPKKPVGVGEGEGDGEQPARRPKKKKRAADTDDADETADETTPAGDAQPARTEDAPRTEDSTAEAAEAPDSEAARSESPDAETAGSAPGGKRKGGRRAERTAEAAPDGGPDAEVSEGRTDSDS